MTNKIFALAAVATALAAGSAAAQPAAGQQPSITYGPPIAGICVLSVENVIASSTVGKYADGRLQQIQAQANAELQGKQSAFEAAYKAFDAQRGTLSQASLEQKAAELQAQQNSLQRDAAIASRELEATQQTAESRILNEIQPLAVTAAEAQHCSIVVNRSAVMMANPAMDISPAVLTALNGKLTQIPIERVRLNQAQAGAAPPVAQVPAQKSTTRK